MAAALLGWDAQIWDSDSDSTMAPFHREWSLMNVVEKEAVRVLGYPREDFRMEGERGEPGADKGWADMSPEEQRCAQLLGWDVTKWHRRDRLPLVVPWVELSSEEQHAAVFLGFTASEFGQPLGCDKGWVEMTKQEQRDVLELGWTNRSWEAGEEHAHNSELLLRRTWHQLSSPQRLAARRLGYTQDDFMQDTGENASIESPPRVPKRSLRCCL